MRSGGLEEAFVGEEVGGRCGLVDGGVELCADALGFGGAEVDHVFESSLDTS